MVPTRKHQSGKGYADRVIVVPSRGKDMFRPNGPARFAYAEARLHESDERRSSALDADPRTWRPDPDEEGEQ